MMAKMDAGRFSPAHVIRRMYCGRSNFIGEHSHKCSFNGSLHDSPSDACICLCCAMYIVHTHTYTARLKHKNVGRNKHELNSAHCTQCVHYVNIELVSVTIRNRQHI